ncbi:hypothetical protein EV44_g3314 [Erysiphe necator]|uniref:Uncharacterized protein n=1 Tax=Uncinula necator TaxID=52586 RepID=A0A0B1P4X4_UNCNE|nr:hypothetical protein EV44_g3314 [Erysiphe necator]
MAPPVFTKCAPPPDPPDVGNRVSNSSTTLNKKFDTTISKVCSTPYKAAALYKSGIIEKKLGVEQFSIDLQAEEEVEMNVVTKEPLINDLNTDPFVEYPTPTGASIDNSVKCTPKNSNTNVTNHSVTSLMDAI